MKFVPLSEDKSWGRQTACLADLGCIDSEISDGYLAGSTISETLETYLEDLVGENAFAGYGRLFPIMVSALELSGRTPLMVCPDDDIAAQRYDSLGKMKLWYITDAQPEAAIYLGFSSGISAKELYDRCMDGTVGEVLHRVTPHKGDAFLIPPGMAHAAEGVMSITEISESSAMDFEICQLGKDTAPAMVAEALDFINLGACDNFSAISAGNAAFDPDVKVATSSAAGVCDIAERLATTKAFTVTRLALNDALHIDTGSSDAFLIYVCVSGAASLQVHRESPGVDSYVIRSGEVILVPASLTDFFIVPEDRDTVLLEATLEPHIESDEYIDPEAEESLPGED